MCANFKAAEQDLNFVCGVQDEGPPPQTIARAPGNANVTENNGSGGEDTVIKKRKTRRGKSKRRNPNPYTKPSSWQQRKNMNNRSLHFNSRKFRSNVLNHGQALAPFNSNQFLMEDHGELQELDDKLNKSDGAAGTSVVPMRTRDSSFSVDSDGDFYSSPEDEEEFLTKEFDNAYEDLHAERLQSMTKAQLIEEYLQLESKVEVLTKRLRGKSTNIVVCNDDDDDGAGVTQSSTNNVTSTATTTTNTSVPASDSVFQQEINKLLLENDELRRENEHLRSGICRSASSFSSSMDSESDSSSSTCNSTTSCSNTAADVRDDQCVTVATTPPTLTTVANYAETNGSSPQPSSPIGV